MSKTIKVGTRGSKLALVQADLVIDSLRTANPQVEFVREVITSSGDRDKTSPIDKIGYGVFVSELENALAAGDIDVAVHSLKDMPSTLDSRFSIAAVPYREDPRDVIVSKGGHGLTDLPQGARVATGSARRKSLLLDRRPDLQVVPVRGNVPTRLEALESPDGPDAAVLAAAGLKRLGLEGSVSEYLKCWDFVAAVGQGALAVETRADDEDAKQFAQPLEHADTRIAVEAERTFLATIEGGCSAPVSAHARVSEHRISIHAFAGSTDGKYVLRAEREGIPSDSTQLARELADELLERGAGELLNHTAGGVG